MLIIALGRSCGHVLLKDALRSCIYILPIVPVVSFNSVVFGERKRQTSPLRYWKVILINAAFLSCVSSCSSVILILHFLAKWRQPHGIALAVSSGMLFHLSYMITFLQIEWNKYLLFQWKFYVYTLGVKWIKTILSI